MWGIRIPDDMEEPVVKLSTYLGLHKNMLNCKKSYSGNKTYKWKRSYLNVYIERIKYLKKVVLNSVNYLYSLCCSICTDTISKCISGEFFRVLNTDTKQR